MAKRKNSTRRAAAMAAVAMAAMIALTLTLTGCENGETDKGSGEAEAYLGGFFDRLNGVTTVAPPSSYTLTARVSPEEGGIVLTHPTDQQYEYPANTQVTVKAEAYYNYEFVAWAGAPAGVDPRYPAITFNINANLALVANFRSTIVQTGTYTLTVSAGNGGKVNPAGTSTYTDGTSVIVTATPDDGYEFTGWAGASESKDATVTVTMSGNLVLNANFRQLSSDTDTDIEGATEAPGTTLSSKLKWLIDKADSHNTYVVKVSADEKIAPHTFEYPGGINITVVIMGSGGNRMVRLSTNDKMFTVRRGVTLVLGNNITLKGHKENTGSMVYVDGGTFIMNAGSTIADNSNNAYSSYGGGVYVYSGNFEMTGGVISGNTAKYGGGVYMSTSGTLAMSGGTISGNTATENGGGVYVSSGNFEMTGGAITGNTAKQGGGVYDKATFTMRGGMIAGNIASEFGGGVYVDWSTFTKVGGTITGSDDTGNNGNAVRGYSGDLARRGFAVYFYHYSSPARREITAGPEDDLSVSGTTLGGVWD